jgi:prepilin-type N-terminal cleavage/methylation domain-containing protein
MGSGFRISRRLARDQSGFSLIEVVIILVIISILTGIALPAFLNQRSKGHDAQAKANVRNALSLIEHCYELEQEYTACDEPEDFSASGIRVTAVAPARTEVQATGSATGFVLLGRSRSDNTFEIVKSDGIVTHDCDTAGTGGCPGAGSSGLSNWTDQGGPESASGGDAGAGGTGTGTGTGTGADTDTSSGTDKDKKDKKDK